MGNSGVHDPKAPKPNNFEVPHSSGKKGTANGLGEGSLARFSCASASRFSIMPKRFTPEQLDASQAVGEPRTEESFKGDTGAWCDYQDAYFNALTPGTTLPRDDEWE